MSRRFFTMSKHVRVLAGSRSAAEDVSAGTIATIPAFTRCHPDRLTMTATDSSNGTGRQAFLEGLRHSDLLPARQLERLSAELPASAQSARDVAERLVSSGIITRFQADRLLAGRTDGFVVGQYVVLEYLGRGAIGRVYKARHRSMNRPVCIHVLASELTQHPADRERVRSEARAIAQLVNPHVVTLLDVNEASERMYLVMEYVDGATAQALVTARGPLDWRTASEVVHQAALGLQHAHDRGVAHGRICSEAILVGRPGSQSTHGRPVIKVTGFGMGRPADDPTHLLTMCGFRAPEQFAAPRKREAHSDIYALGCVFFQLLTGRLPFAAATADELARHHSHTPPPQVQYLRPDVPQTVANLITLMLAKNPQQRPSAQEVASRLSRHGAADDHAAVIDFALLPSAVPTGQDSGPLSAVSPQQQAPNPLSADYLLPREERLPDDAISDQNEPQHAAPTRVMIADPHEQTPISTWKDDERDGEYDTGAAPRKKRPARRRGVHPIFILALMALLGAASVLTLIWLLKKFGS